MPVWMAESSVTSVSQASDPWPGWSRGTTGSSDVVVWGAWTSTAVITTSSVTGGLVWPNWVAETAAPTWWRVHNNRIVDSPDHGVLVSSGCAGTSLSPPSERDRRLYETRRRARAMRGRVAQRRAERLLLEHLDEEQAREWARGKAFTVETAGAQRRYRISLGLAGNVMLVEENGRPAVRRRYCAHVYHPDGQVPNEDNCLAQKLLLESNEAEFLRMANVS